MASTSGSALGWLDYREEDARLVRELLRAFEEKGTLDSIGIGTVRDALADVLFPGLSTLHTRARYFFFLPWVYRGLERDVREGHVGAARAATVARQREAQLIDALIEGGAEQQGIIGVRAREKVRTLPRDVYWSGLRRFGFLLFGGTSRSYLESLGQRRPTRVAQVRTDDGESLAGALGAAWRPGIPPAPDDLLESATFDLSAQEAAYLLERIVESVPGSLLAELAQRRPEVDGIGMPWHVPGFGDLPAHTREAVAHAEMFSTVMFGAQVLYNELLVAQMRADAGSGAPDNLTHADEAIAAARDQWLALMEDASARIATWDRRDFWRVILEENPRIPLPTRAFIDRWLDAATADGEAALADDTLQQEVVDREHVLKRSLARLSNPRARELADPPFGLEPLNYRWLAIGRTLVTDIAQGLAQGGAHA